MNDLRTLESMIRIRRIAFHSKEELVRYRMPYSPTTRGLHSTTNPTILELLGIDHQRLVLKPGDSETVTFFADQDVGRSDNGRFFFPAPGEYRIDLEYRGAVSLGRNLEVKKFLIRVDEPQGVDAQVYELLKKHPTLVQHMLSCHTSPYQLPDENTLSLLERIANRYPHSSYADYARFALARAYVKGPNPNAEATRDEKRAALEQIKRIDLKTFPYAPSVLIFELGLASEARQDEINKILATEYRDAFEWLNQQADMISQEEWHKIRHNPPVTRPPRSRIAK